MPPLKSIAFRAYPKIVFAWPVALAALGAGLSMQFWPERLNQIGFTFGAVTVGTLVVLAFEFSRGRALSVLLGVTGLVLAMILVNQRHPFFAPLHGWLSQRQIHASMEFYFAIFGAFAVIYFGIFLRTRFDYWTLSASELVHKRGFLGETERFPTTGLKLRKEITDVLEYMILGAGRIVLTVPGVPHPVVLENVIGCHRVERFAADVLDARIVRLEQESAA